MELFHLLNPISHADTPEKVARYKVEPYVIAADIYSVRPRSCPYSSALVHLFPTQASVMKHERPQHPAGAFQKIPAHL